MSFAPLGLEPELLNAVADQGYTQPTPVQAEAIPLVLAGRDVLAGAQTGTGKTAAFVLPILQILNGRPSHGAPTSPAVDPRDPRGLPDRGRRDGVRPPVRCLILTPTRELAIQVEESVRTYGARRPIRSAVIYGGVGFDPQVRALRGGAQIVVATPGRLLDHVGQGTIDLSRVEVLVLDEADRMLDMGFIRDIRKILALLPTRRQNLLFSATFSNDIRRLADGILDHPAEVQVTPRNTTTELVRQVVHPVDRERKRELLSHLIKTGRIDQALVFARTKHGASRLAEQLERDGIAATAIHGNKSQPQRNRALADFKAGRATVLVATDIAARGIDIDALPHVVNFELPMAPEDYVHRIGRTARAGMDGDAVSLVCVDEQKLLWQIETLLRTKIQIEVVEGFEPDRTIRPQPILLRSAAGRSAVAPGRSGRSGPANRTGFTGPHRPQHAATAGPREVTSAPRHAAAGSRQAQPRRPGQSIGAYQPAARPNGRPVRPATGRPTGQGAPRGAHPGDHSYGPTHQPGGQRPPAPMPGERLARATGPHGGGGARPGGHRPNDRQRQDDRQR